MATEKHKCEFCKKEFVRERTLINHLCEKKRRWFNRDQKSTRIGFEMWVKYYELTGLGKRKKKTYEEFMNTNFYIAFVKFGMHVLQTNMINPLQFLEFVIKKHIKLDDWCKDSVYEEYVRSVCRKEDVGTAMERQILLMEQWSRETEHEWTDFFNKIETGLALKWIQAGRISPWVLLNSETANNLFSRMSDEQIMLIDSFVNMKTWRIKFIKQKEDCEFVKNILEKYGI